MDCFVHLANLLMPPTNFTMPIDGRHGKGITAFSCTEVIHLYEIIDTFAANK